MATIQQNGSQVTGNYYTGGSTANNRGTAMRVGSQSSILENRDSYGYDAGFVGSKVVDATDTDPAIGGVDIQVNTVRPIAPRLTSTIATQTNTVLLSIANEPYVESIHNITGVITNQTATAFRTGFNMFTNTYVSGVNTQTDVFADDNAALPTRSVPGQLVYQIGSKVPVTSNYKAKTN